MALEWQINALPQQHLATATQKLVGGWGFSRSRLNSQGRDVGNVSLSSAACHQKRSEGLTFTFAECSSWQLAPFQIFKMCWEACTIPIVRRQMVVTYQNHQLHAVPVDVVVEGFEARVGLAEKGIEMEAVQGGGAMIRKDRKR